MLKRHSQLFVSLILLCDLCVTAGAWTLAYVLRFHVGLLEVTKGSPAVESYLVLLPVAVLVSLFCYRYAGLYRPRRQDNLGAEAMAVLVGTFFTLAVLLALTFFVREYEYSRAVVAIFAILNPALLLLERLAVRVALRQARARGFNVRRALVVGAGKTGQKLVEAVQRNPWTGIEPVGYLDERPERAGRAYRGVSVLGPLAELNDRIAEHRVDQVFIALPGSRYGRLKEVMDSLSETMVDVRIVPDLFSFDTLNREVNEFEGLPIVSLRESPLFGWNRLLKRLMDVAFSGLVLLILSPLLLLLALLVKLTSPGPVFYRQERMGLGGDLFGMIKFRSMRVDAEAQTGAVWAKENDPRRTRFGTFLRKTSMDELPQFLNVLLGDMSVVGPRPERPVFIEDFKKKIPRYMFRHKMKAGITGWAQVNGWRGNTSLRKRIQYDLYYIEHWSLWFDVQIVFLTVFKGLVGKNAY